MKCLVSCADQVTNVTELCRYRNYIILYL